MTWVRINAMSPNRALAAALGTVLVAALTGAVALGAAQLFRIHRESVARHERVQVLKAVRAEVLALTNISASSTDSQIKGFLDGMTPHLRGEFEPQVDSFRQAMVRSKVRSQGRIIAIGVMSSGAHHASALVAAAARVSNSRTAGDQQRNYRLSLSLQKARGRWLVDSMEFVP